MSKKCPPDTFYTSLRTGAALSNPASPSKKFHTIWCGTFLANDDYWDTKTVEPIHVEPPSCKGDSFFTQGVQADYADILMVKQVDILEFAE